MAYICPLRALLGSGLLRFAGMPLPQGPARQACKLASALERMQGLCPCLLEDTAFVSDVRRIDTRILHARGSSTIIDNAHTWQCWFCNAAIVGRD